MDIGEFLNGLRPVGTVISFLTFIGIMWWAFSSRRKEAYEEAARLPFDQDDDLPSDAPRSSGATQSKGNAS